MIETIMKLVDEIPQNIEFTPMYPWKFQIGNLFGGYNSTLKLLTDKQRVEKLIRPWRLVGSKLCESMPNFILFEKWLARLIQYPNSQTDLSFAFTCSELNNLKLDLMKSIQKILGSHNVLNCKTIPKHSDLAMKLLFIFDEGKNETRTEKKRTKDHENLSKLVKVTLAMNKI